MANTRSNAVVVLGFGEYQGMLRAEALANAWQALSCADHRIVVTVSLLHLVCISHAPQHLVVAGLSTQLVAGLAIQLVSTCYPYILMSNTPVPIFMHAGC
jgi:hypothetical protein